MTQNTTPLEALKPCPFCGGEAYDRQMVDFGGVMCSLIACRDCGANSPVKRDNSAKAWNTRPGEQAACKAYHRTKLAALLDDPATVAAVARGLCEKDCGRDGIPTDDPTSEWYRANPENPQFVWQLHIGSAQAALNALKQIATEK